MKSAWLWSVLAVLVGLGAFGGCGGTSDSGDGPASAGAGAGNTAGKTSSQGGSSAMNGGASSAGESSLEACNEAECGPQLGLLNWTCEDGSIGGPTGRCIRQASGSCGWEINDCAPAGEGGASSQGGQSNFAGAPGEGGASADECGGCNHSGLQVCVYQVGGPGPSRFVCATQNPCGAAGACACIVAQGSCESELMGAPPGYCVCDNGLD